MPDVERWWRSQERFPGFQLRWIMLRLLELRRGLGMNALGFVSWEDAEIVQIPPILI